MNTSSGGSCGQKVDGFLGGYEELLYDMNRNRWIFRPEGVTSKGFIVSLMVVKKEQVCD